MFCRTVQLELHYISIVLRLEHHVDAALAGVVFCTHVNAEQLAKDEQHILIMVLTLLHQFVRRVGKETFQTVQEGFGVPFAYFLYKLLDMERGLNLVHRSIKRQKEAEESVFNLFVWESQLISAEFRFEAFDGQITALVNDRNGIGRSYIHAVENVFRDVFIA